MRGSPFQFAAIVIFLFGVFLSPLLAATKIDPFEKVNTGQPGRIITPVNQVLTPAGIQVELPKLRPQALALSPDGKVLATSGKTHELILVDPVNGRILDQIALPSEKATNSPETVSTHILTPDQEGQLSFTGLLF